MVEVVSTKVVCIDQSQCEEFGALVLLLETDTGTVIFVSLAAVKWRM